MEYVLIEAIGNTGMTNKEILSLPRRALCVWEHGPTRRTYIVFTDNAFGYYLKTIAQFKSGDFKSTEIQEKAQELEFVVKPLPDVSFRVLAIKMHQELHDLYVRNGWHVFSVRPEQTLKKNVLPSDGGWVVYLDTTTSRYRYKKYLTINAYKSRGESVTIEQMLLDLNRRSGV